MTKGRLEAFCDAVLAIIMTIMVLELRAPHGTSLMDLQPLAPKITSYVLSFVFIGIYWSNHHHMLHTITKVTGAVLWSNIYMLFWLSLVPFATAWVGETGFASGPVSFYGIVMIGAATGYQAVELIALRSEGPDSAFARALGDDLKGKLSIALYTLALILSFSIPKVAASLFLVVALMWLVPDRRFERVFQR